MWVCVDVLQTLGKLSPFVHINAMSDQHDNSSDTQRDDTPQYRVRKPEGETTAPKSAQNTAEIASAAPGTDAGKPADTDKTKEIGGPKGPEPTRFGDWERDGRCVDF